MNKLSSLNSAAQASFDVSNTYSDVVHFVHIYSVEAHPQSPDTSPYSGDVWELSWSTKLHAKTYSEREANAIDAEAYITGNQLMLVDELTPLPRNNPVWCTYGPVPNGAYLIAQDGLIVAAQQWLDVNAMKTHIDNLLD
jgi:hypothetical protein